LSDPSSCTRIEYREISSHGTGTIGMLLGSQAMRTLLVHFAMYPGSEIHLRALQRATGLGIRSLQTELPRLVEMGLIRRTDDGKHVRYTAEPSHPAWPALRSLIRSFVDVREVMRIALGPVNGIRAAFVFGSYARGTNTGESDVDVLVVGNGVPRGELTRHAVEASMLLGREVNPLVYSPDELRDRVRSGSAFADEILHGPKMWIIGNDQQIEAA
jgi:predicted nucleotidyltransferase